MRWLVMLLALSLAPACTTKPSQTEKEASADKAKKSADKAKKGADRAAAKKPGDKGAAKKGADGKAGAEKKPAPVYGAAGQVVGELKLEAKTEGEKTRTVAELALVSGEKEETVKLGGILGTCAPAAPAKVDDLTALWTVACDTAQGKATVAIAQQGSALLVARAPAGSDEYKPMRKIKLAEGAEVVAKAQP